MILFHCSDYSPNFPYLVDKSHVFCDDGDLWYNFSWDDKHLSAVHSPIGMFFGMGQDLHIIGECL
ncbi:hypothetical protein D2U88_07940 [Flagellimonas aequoris]|uniref:Uncharacterized protein n=1 Tax=Flagellimonas aequoris TaxID=2306997 RepID=A0A418N8D0_9FLAO|nr:hypothetical protein D2U88_07940 [Allomuricauda aequoris]